MNYLEELQAEVETGQAERQRQKESAAAKNIAAYREMTPLVDRLRALLDSIPPEIRQHGVSITDLQARLRGIGGQKPHIGCLGACLRTLGYTRHRTWRAPATAPFSAVWKAAK
jgi:hypothetical protein